MMFREQLKQYVVDNPKMVKMRSAGDDIFVLKYSKSVFFDGTWNRYVEECRGSIVDSEFNLITYPFTKIFNYNIEKQAPVFSDIEKVTAFRKINGFMVAMTYHNGDVLVSTTGSTDSEFVDMAKELMLRHMPWEDWQIVMSTDDMRGMTFMFEAVHERDPHIIPENSGLYILGYRENEFQSKVGHDCQVLTDLGAKFNCLVPEAFEVTVGDLVAMSKSVKHEGFVFYHKDGRAAKIKSPHYLISKFVARNPRTEKLMRPDVKKSLDEEYYGLIDAIQANIDEYTAMTEQQRLAWVREFFGDSE